MLRIEAASIVAKPDIVSRLAQQECKTVIVVCAVRASTLKETVHKQDRVSSPTIFVLSPDRVVLFADTVGEYLWRRWLLFLSQSGFVFGRVVDVEEGDDETIFGLDLELF